MELMKGRRSGRNLRDVLDSFLQGLGVSIRIGPKKQRVRRRRSSRPARRRLHVPADVLSLASDSPSYGVVGDEVGPTGFEALTGRAATNRGQGAAERRMQVETSAA